MEGHPAAEEHEGGDSGDDEEVEVLGQVEEAEVYAGVLGVVAGGELVLCLGKVEWAAVGLGGGGYDVDDECDDGGYVASEDEPGAVLLGDNLADA